MKRYANRVGTHNYIHDNGEMVKRGNFRLFKVVCYLGQQNFRVRHDWGHCEDNSKPHLKHTVGNVKGQNIPNRRLVHLHAEYESSTDNLAKGTASPTLPPQTPAPDSGESEQAVGHRLKNFGTP